MLIVAIVSAWVLCVLAALALMRVATRADKRETTLLAELAARAELPDRRGSDGAGLAEPAGDVKPGGYSAVLLKRLAVQACRIVGVDAAAIFVSDDSGAQHVLAAGHHLGGRAVGSRFGDLAAAMEDPRIVTAAGLPVDYAALLPVGSSALVVRATGRTRSGVLVGAGTRPFNERDLALARHLADLVGASIDDVGLGGHLDAALEGGVRALEAALDSVDLQSAQSKRELVTLATEIGRGLGLEDPALVELQLAARLRSAGDLVEDGRAMPQASGSAAHLLTQVPGLEVVALIVQHERERWDGHGLPDGLEADRIPLASRILAVTAEFCRLTAPEGVGLSAAEATYVLADGAGRSYDPTVVEAVAARFAPALFSAGAEPVAASARWAAGDRELAAA